MSHDPAIPEDLTVQDMNVRDIEEETRSGRMLIRIHDWESESMYDDRDGFTATDSQFDGITTVQYQGRYQHLAWERAWLFSRQVVTSVVRHIVGACYPSGEPIPSPWISTTINFNWAVWEIAHRLTSASRRMAVIQPGISMTLVAGPQHQVHQGGGLTPIYVQPSKYLKQLVENKVERDDVTAAYEAAAISSEILVYGRIFPQEIQESTVWTYDVPPHELPPWHYTPLRDQPNAINQSWLHHLSWNPWADDFATAQRKMMARREEFYGI